MSGFEQCLVDCKPMVRDYSDLLHCLWVPPLYWNLTDNFRTDTSPEAFKGSSELWVFPWLYSLEPVELLDTP